MALVALGLGFCGSASGAGVIFTCVGDCGREGVDLPGLYRQQATQAFAAGLPSVAALVFNSCFSVL